MLLQSLSRGHAAAPGHPRPEVSTPDRPTSAHPASGPAGADAGLCISLSTGIGRAPTPLAAFDAALREVGAGDLNLVRLSSVIPPGATLQRTPQLVQQAGWGDRLYCVYAERHAERPGAAAAAGVGWVHKLDGSGAGLFVEHDGESEQEVAEQIHASLDAMARGRGGGFTAPDMTLVSAECTGEPLCVLALASYAAESWAG